MEKIKTLAARKYYYLTTNRYFEFITHQTYDESLFLIIENSGGQISFTITNISTNEITAFSNPETGEYIIPLIKGSKMKLEIKSSKAIGAYKIVRKTIIPN